VTPISRVGLVVLEKKKKDNRILGPRGKGGKGTVAINELSGKNRGGHFGRIWESEIGSVGERIKLEKGGE